MQEPEPTTWAGFWCLGLGLVLEMAGRSGVERQEEGARRTRGVGYASTFEEVDDGSQSDLQEDAVESFEKTGPHQMGLIDDRVATVTDGPGQTRPDVAGGGRGRGGQGLWGTRRLIRGTGA